MASAIFPRGGGGSQVLQTKFSKQFLFSNPSLTVFLSYRIWTNVQKCILMF